MTRTSFSIPLRLASTAIAAVAVLSLSGCLYAQIPAGSPTDVPSSSPETDAPSDESSGSTLTFAEGLDLASDTYIEWGDGLVVDEGWKIVSPDDGNGAWTYGTVDGTCTARFWQGYTTDVPVVAGDDSASSDAILGVLLQTPTSEVTPLTTTGEFSYMTGGNGGVETRQVVGVDGSRTWLMAARAFTQTGVGLSVVVDCTAADAEATLAAINEENAVVVTP